MSLRTFLAVLLSLMLASPAGFAQQASPAAAPAPASDVVTYSDKPNVPVAPGNFLTRPYRQAEVAPVKLENSARLEGLLRAGKLYLSLQDTIALVLENNLDIEMSRYGPQLAQTDFLRAQAGGLLRGVPSTVQQGPSSAQSQAGISTGTGGTNSGGGSSSSGGTGGTVITQTGVAIPNLDPSFYFASQFGHASAPQSNTVTTGGLTAIQYNNRIFNTGYQQSWVTGTSFSAAFNNSRVYSNNPFNDLNPNTSSNVSVQISQRILQGWGLAVNNRNIRIAKNDLRISDLTFKLQVMTTVSAAVNLYWDLVSFYEDAKVKAKALEVAKKFADDNRKQVEIGTLAPIEIVRAEARVAEAEMDLTNSETAVMQQETIIKNAISRNGVASPSVADARIVPTDALMLPQNDVIENARDLEERALAIRPDLEQTRINLVNTKIGIAGSKSQLLPSLDVQANLANNGLTGQINQIPYPNQPGFIRNPDAYFIGPYSNALAQIFRHNFPNYAIGFQLSMPIRNRTAQADYIRDELSLRQAQLSQQQQINQTRVTVRNAVIAVIQARARYQAAVKDRQLQEQTLDAENKKYALGASTAFLVVQTQRDLATAQGSEVSALSAYSRARVQLDLATGDILSKYEVNIDEARTGKVTRASTLPNN
jgi:outer membrane protein